MTKYDDMEEVINSLKERLTEMTAISEMQTKIESIMANINGELEKVEAARVELLGYSKDISIKYDSFTSKITEDTVAFKSGVEERLAIIENNLDKSIDKLNADLSELRDLTEFSISKTANELQLKIESIDDTAKKEFLELRKQIDDMNRQISDLENKFNSVKNELENEKNLSMSYQHKNDRKVIVALIVGLIGVAVGIIGVII